MTGRIISLNFFMTVEVKRISDRQYGKGGKFACVIRNKPKNPRGIEKLCFELYFPTFDDALNVNGEEQIFL